MEIAGEKVRTFPVVFCLRGLPAGMPTGENIAETVRVTGYMFKKWKYNTHLAEKKSPGLRMTSPLLIGKTAVWERPAVVHALVGPVVGGALLAAVAVFGLFGWWYCRRDRRIHAAVRAKSYALAEGQSLNDLKLDFPESADESSRD
jgi:hypothetical protein